MFAIILFTAFVIPQRIEVSRVEINEVSGRFTQVIVWRWCRLHHPSYHVADWRIVTPENHFSYCRVCDGYRVAFVEHDDKPVVLFTKLLYWTVTSHDPEVADRRILPQEDREHYLQ